MDETEAAGLSDFLDDARLRLARAFIAAFGRDRGEEALAEALAYAWEHFPRLIVMDNPVGYLYRVGQSRTRTRSRRVLFPSPTRADFPDVEPALLDALEGLSDRQRVCTLLVHAYDWSQADVADLLGISASSVHRHIERGLEALRQRIGAIDD